MTLRARMWTVLCLATAIGVALTYLTYGQIRTDKEDQHPGLLPYTPSRIEWLALELQALYGDTDFGTRRYKITYLSTGPETISILAHYVAGVDREEMNKAVESARRIIGMSTRNRGWNWVQVKEQYEKFE